jgi:chromate reductase, NAD(P)H dehydrogenase (quinone)
MPEHAKRFRQLLIESDAVLITSPEYNGSVSGILKNTLDWASRSENGQPSRDAFKGKKFAIMSASPGPGGGARGLEHLRTIIENVGGIVVQQRLSVPNAYNAFDPQGALRDDTLKHKLSEEIQQLLQ